jgi:hypothetical protein
MTSNPDSESKPVLLPRLSLAAVDRPIALMELGRRLRVVVVVGHGGL